MKKIHLILISIFISTLYSCKGQTDITTLEGKIYIKLIDLKSLYGSSKEEIDSLKKEIQLFDASKTNSTEQAYYSYYDMLFKENLIDKPSALVKDKEGKVKRVFFSVNDYTKQVEPLLTDLDKNNEHIDLSLEIKERDTGLYVVTKIVSIEKNKGKTEWKK